MNVAADIILAAGTITVLNEAVFAPAAGGKVSFQWRVIPATGILALLIDGLAELSPQLALGVSLSVLATILLVPMGTAGSPVGNLSKAMGYQK